MRRKLTAERVRELFVYRADDGTFIRASRAGKCRSGSIATGTLSHGYIVMSVDGSLYAAHRLAWLWVHGELPMGDIDHIDGDRANNRLANLRDVDRSMNLQNLRSAKSHNKSTGVLGAYLHKPSGRYTSRIGVNGKNLHLGMFDSIEDAHAAYLEAKRRHHKGNTL